MGFFLFYVVWNPRVLRKLPRGCGCCSRQQKDGASCGVEIQRFSQRVARSTSTLRPCVRHLVENCAKDGQTPAVFKRSRNDCPTSQTPGQRKDSVVASFTGARAKEFEPGRAVLRRPPAEHLPSRPPFQRCRQYRAYHIAGQWPAMTENPLIRKNNNSVNKKLRWLHTRWYMARSIINATSSECESNQIVKSLS